MTHVQAPVRSHRYRGPLAATLALALIGGSFAAAAPFAAAADPVITENGWSYTKDSYATDVRNGYQLALDQANRKAYLTDAAWSTQTRTADDNGDGTYTYGPDVFTVGSGKLSTFDVATRTREADHSFLNLTRNDGNGRENEPFSWANAAASAKSINSMRTTFSPYGVAVDGTTPGGATIVTTTARQQDAEEGFGGGVVVYNATQGAPADADRIFEFEDGSPVFAGPRRIAVNTRTHKAYVTSLGSSRGRGPAGFITQIDLLTKQVEARITVPNALGAVGVAVDEDHNRIYVGAMLAGKQYVIDGAAVKTTDAKDLELNNDAVTELAADLPGNQRPTYDSVLKRLYVSSYDAKVINVIDADPASAGYGTLLDTIETGPTNAVEVDGQRGLLYSANLGDKNVVVFDTDTHEKLLTLPTSGNAINIGIDPVTRDVWVSNFSNAGQVDVFSVISPLIETQVKSNTNQSDAGILVTPRNVPLGSDITISGKGWFKQNGTGGSAGPIFINQPSGGTGPVSVAGRTIENQIPGSNYSDARAHAVFLSDDEGNWTITIPFPTPANSTLTEATAWKVGDVQTIRILTGSLADGDHSRNPQVSFTIVDAEEEPEPEPVEDKAEATAPAEWVEGEDLTVTGTGWTWENGTGSTIAVKLNRGATAPLTNSDPDIPDDVWAVVRAEDTTGAWSVTLPYPSAAVAKGTIPAVGDNVTVHLLTGSMAPGDRVRGVTKTVPVVADPDAPEPTTSPSPSVSPSPSPSPSPSVTPKPTPKPTPTPTASPEPKPVAPVATVKPSLSGTPAVGSTLTAKPGTWNTAGLAFTYQWLRNGTAIGGATKSTYRVVSADAGKSLSVRVTASKSGVPNGTATSAAVKAGKKLTKTPTPTISGKAKAGKTLKAKAGTWAPSKVTVKYQWLRDGQPIAKATKSSYKLGKADAGRKITVRVTGSKSGYVSVAKTSKAKSVAKVKATAKLTVPSKVAKGKQATVKVTVTAAASKPTGKVKVTVNGKTVTAVLTAAGKGKVSVKLPAIAKKGSYKVKASFTPTGDTAKSTSKSSTVSKTLKVR